MEQEGVRSGSARQLVRTRAAVQSVVAEPALEYVGTKSSQEGVVPIVADQGIRAAVSGQFMA